MTPETIARAAEFFDAARRNARIVDAVPSELRPDTVADGHALVAALAARHAGIVGWKVGGGWPASVAAMGLPHPIGGPLFADYVQGSPARFDRKRWIAPLVECEIAFVLGKDLPRRAAPYTPAEVDAAVAAIVPGIEIVDPRVKEKTPALMMADSFANGAYVRGANWTDWRALDLASVAMSLRYDGRTVARGTGGAIPGGPFNVLVTLANNQAAGSAGLKAGQFVTTGNCSGDCPLGDARDVVADFGRLGEVRLHVSA